MFNFDEHVRKMKIKAKEFLEKHIPKGFDLIEETALVHAQINRMSYNKVKEISYTTQIGKDKFKFEFRKIHSVILSGTFSKNSLFIESARFIQEQIKETDQILNINRDALFEVLELPKKLPADFEETQFGVPCFIGHDRKFLGFYTVQIRNPGTELGHGFEKFKVNFHRVFVVCNCDRSIPFGRIAQHAKACKLVYKKVTE